MAIDRDYALQVWFRTDNFHSIHSDAHVSLTHRLTQELKDRFAGRAEQVVVNPPPLNVSGQPYVGHVEMRVPDRRDVWDAHAWLLERVRPHLPQAFVSAQAARAGASVVQARWVPLESDWYNVELGKEYGSPANRRPVGCDRCGMPDFEAAPDPFYVDGCIASAGRNEFLPAQNGVFVVSARVRDILRASVAEGEFTSGPVVSRGRKPAPGEFFWIRPTRRIGGQPAESGRGDRCPGCGIAAERLIAGVDVKPLPLAPVVEHFGDPAWNLALVGEHPLGERSRMAEEGGTWLAAISGGLFAVLWNHGVKGLKWPKDGPYLSLREDEDTWEPARRFAGVFPSAVDKARKQKSKG